MHEFIELYGKIDNLTGLLNRNGIMEKIETEVYRFKRYGRAFSLIMIQADIKKARRQDISREASGLAAKSAGEVLLANLRKTDILGRWDETTFLALLPETTEKGATKAAGKLLGKLKNHTFIYNGKPYALNVKIEAVEYGSSLKESLDRLCRKMT